MPNKKAQRSSSRMTQQARKRGRRKANNNFTITHNKAKQKFKI